MSELLRTREQRNVNDLEPHSFNTRIYNVETDELEEKIEQHGFEPIGRLQIKPDGTILSGHRRWKAAKEVGLDEVPVEVVEPENDTEEKRLILLANEYRDKTPAEKIREGEAWEEIEKEKAKERQGQRTDQDEHCGQSTTKSEQGKRREKVGEKIGVSGKTYERGKEVKEKADAGDKTAQEQWEKMEKGKQSIHGAMKEVKKSENQTDDDPEPEQSDPRDEHTKLSLQRVCDDGAAIYTDSRGNTYLIESDDLPK